MRWLPVLSLLIPLLSGGIWWQDEAYTIRSHYTKFEFRIPMRDGARLFTALYVPKDQSHSYPILMMRTPYGIAPYGPDNYPKNLYPGDNFTRSGYIFVYQDVRGRYMSEGTWTEMTPFQDHSNPRAVDESTDAYDTIEWLLHHVPENNGKVGLIGISYPGFYAAAGLVDSHPAVKAVSPQAPIADLYMGDDSYHNGAFLVAANFGFYTWFRPQSNRLKPAQESHFDYETNDAYKFYLKLGPVANADEKYLKYSNPYWTDVVKHTTYDQFWRSRSLLPHLGPAKPAVLIVGGWYDAEDLSGTLQTYRRICETNPTGHEWIVMGPWSHGQWQGEDGSKLGAIHFGSKTAETFRNEVQFPFFEQRLKNGKDAGLSPAYMFETGSMHWRRYSQWPPTTAQKRKLYLHPGGVLNWTADQPTEGFDQYTSDPNKPVPYYEHATSGIAPEYMDADQRFAARRADVLSYQTNPLEEDTTIAGPVLPTLHVSTSGTDSDYIVKLIDVFPQDDPNSEPSRAPTRANGYEQLVRGEPFRGKFRHSFQQAQAFKPDKTEKIRFTMPDVNHCFRRGHRIMVQIQSSWFPLVDRNPQIFTDIPAARLSDFRTATERIFHSAADPSYLEVTTLP